MSNRVRDLNAYTVGSGRPRMTMVRLFRHLGEVDLLPRGLPGRRSESLTVEHHAIILKSMAGDQPSDGAEAVRTLDTLVCNTNALSNLDTDHSGIPRVKPGTPFPEWLVQDLEARVAGDRKNYTSSDPEIARFVEPMHINMSLNPPRVAVIRHLIDASGQPIIDKFHIEHFVGSDPRALMGQNTPPYYRQTFITERLLDVAASLLIETRAKQAATSIPTPVPGRTGVGDATPDKIEAAGSGNHDGLVLHQPTAASASASAPAFRSASASPCRTNRLRPVNRSKANPSQTLRQPTFAMGDGHSGDRPRDVGPSTCNP